MAVDTRGDIWLTYYGLGRLTAWGGASVEVLGAITTDQEALTDCRFGRLSDKYTFNLANSVMERVTGYVYGPK